MRIGIIGIRGVPNFHGGFEQFAEFLSEYIAKAGHDIYVYNSHNHPYQETLWKGVHIIHKYDPEFKMGTIGQFIYDFNCILDARKRNFDIILQLGYTSNTIWYKWLPKNTVIISNMDGLEWKRSKYPSIVRMFLKYAEKLAVKSSDYLISDSIGIQNYLFKKYNAKSEYIAYGANMFKNPCINILSQYKVKAYNYNMLIARFEPENNLETILDGTVLSDNKTPFLVIGKHDVNKLGAYLKNKYKYENNIIFLGGIYNLEHLNNLRYYSNLYFHGHSVGGTNPSLLEAMASKALIIAHDNEFNKSILKSNAFYFKSKEEVKYHIENTIKVNFEDKISNCYMDIENNYTLEKINKTYLTFLSKCKK